MVQDENLKSFFEKIKALTFWKRVFFWNTVKVLSYEAYDEYRKLSSSIENLDTQLKEKDSTIGNQGKELQILSARVSDLLSANQKLEGRISILESDLKRIMTEKGEMANRIARFEQTEQSRLEEFQKNVSNVNAIKAGLEGERQKLHDDRLKETEESFERMKQKWQNHEDAVKKTIMSICQANQIEYVREVPFKGKPDNTIKIAGEYVIFDAKSPAGDDLENFPKYLKVQTESVSKYMKQENVKSEIFLVVPSNTAEVIGQFSYRMGDYNVYVVTIDALEPIILSLQKIEYYEFAEQLTPDERENICRIIGKFAHTAKRKIMIDYFFSFQFLDIISKCNLTLPEDIYKSVVDFEKSEKLNPPQEKRSKIIPVEDILAESERLAAEAKARISGINENIDDK
jgi:hypothetical protein